VTVRTFLVKRHFKSAALAFWAEPLICIISFHEEGGSQAALSYSQHSLRPLTLLRVFGVRSDVLWFACGFLGEREF
jgi:hypothetical protein